MHLESSCILLRFGRGKDGLFRNQDNPGWAGAEFRVDPNGRWELLEKDGTRMRFDENGRLSERLTRTGQAIKLTRDSYGKLVKYYTTPQKLDRVTWW